MEVRYPPEPESLTFLNKPLRCRLPKRSLSTCSRLRLSLHEDQTDGIFEQNQQIETRLPNSRPTARKHEEDEIYPYILRPQRTTRPHLLIRQYGQRQRAHSSPVTDIVETPNETESRFRTRSSSASTESFPSASSSRNSFLLHTRSILKTQLRSSSPNNSPRKRKKSRLSNSSFRSSSSCSGASVKSSSEHFWNQYRRQGGNSLVERLLKRTGLPSRRRSQGDCSQPSSSFHTEMEDNFSEQEDEVYIDIFPDDDKNSETNFISRMRHNMTQRKDK